jgi:hypothetical protein
MRTHIGVGFAGLLLIASALSVSAHHSHRLFYDQCKSVTIEGRVENIHWKNPHVWIDLTMGDGTTYHAEWTSLEGVTDALTADARSGHGESSTRPGSDSRQLPGLQRRPGAENRGRHADSPYGRQLAFGQAMRQYGLRRRECQVGGLHRRYDRRAA